MKTSEREGALTRRGLRKLTLAAAVVAGSLAATLAGAEDKPELTVAVTNVAASGGGALDTPVMGAGMPYSWFLEPAYGALIFMAPDGTFKPGLADEWGYTDNNMKFHLKLHPGMTFSSGEPVTAEAVKGWLEWYAAQGGSWTSKVDYFESIDTPDDLTLVLNLKKPSASLPFDLSQRQIGYVISPEGVTHRDKIGAATFGAGPYVLDSAATVLGSKYVYTARADYVGPMPPQWSKITLLAIPEPSARLAAVQSGQVDLAMGDADTAEAAKTAGLHIAQAPSQWDGIILFDREGKLLKPLGDYRVRQALMMAVDRQAVADAVFGEFGTPSVQPAADGQTSYVPELNDEFAYNPEKAKQLLAEAGYPDGFTLDVMMYRRMGQEPLFAEALAGYYADIGVTLNIVQLERSEIVPHIKAQDYPALIFFSTLQEADFQANNLFLPTNILNAFHTEDKELQEMDQKFLSAPPDQQPDIQRQMMRRIVEQGYIPIYSTSAALYFYNDRVSNVETSGGNPEATLLTVTPAK